jgi:IS30 family transposase
MTYHHLNIRERFKIELYTESKLSKAEISRRLGRDYKTVLEEIRKGSYPDGRYGALHAQGIADRKRKQGKRKSKKLIKDEGLREYVIEGLKDGKSPDQIMGERRISDESYVSNETIYSFIYTENKNLIPYLRQKKGKYRRRHGTKKRGIERELMNKRRIDSRPKEIDEKIVIGHWEGDSIVGKEKQNGVGTFVERVSGYAQAMKLNNMKAEEMMHKTIKAFRRIPKDKKKTITCDNGSEFAEYESTEKKARITFYFAYPYHSWERGCNENWNGLFRQYFPKGTDFAKVTQREIDKVVEKLNNRPRKRLNYLTPHQVFTLKMNPKNYGTSN